MYLLSIQNMCWKNKQLPKKHLESKFPITFETLNFGCYVLKRLYLLRNSLYVDVNLLRWKQRLGTLI